MILHSKDIWERDPDCAGGKSITEWIGGQNWQSWYNVVRGELHVYGAWGSRVEPVGRRRNLEKRARELLREIVRERWKNA